MSLFSSPCGSVQPRDAISAWCDCDWLTMEAVLELGLEGLLIPRPLPQFQAKSEASFI